MAGNGFTVRPEALRELARRLALLNAQLAEARSITQGVEVSGFGHPKLGEATGAFTDAWQWQTERLVGTVNDVGDRLVQAAAQYQQVEDSQLSMQGKKA